MLLYLFYFVSTYNKILIVAIFSQFFCFFSALFIFFCFLLYFLILFAFSFRKIINFLLVPLVFKFENTFLVFFVFFVALFILFCD